MDRFWLNLDPVDSLKRLRSIKGCQTLPQQRVRQYQQREQQCQDNESYGSRAAPSLMTLPVELRLRILSFTGLTPQDPKDIPDGSLKVQLVDDKLRIRRPFASTEYDGIFISCRALRGEAIDTMLSGNRLVLLDCDCELPDPSCAMASLQILSPGMLRRMRELDIRLRVPWLLDSDVEGETYLEFVKSWKKLIGFIASSFTLSHLKLIIDASWEYDMIAELGVSEERLAKYAHLYNAVAEPLLSLNRLHDLRLHLACHPDLEETIVRRVMVQQQKQPVARLVTELAKETDANGISSAQKPEHKL